MKKKLFDSSTVNEIIIDNSTGFLTAKVTLSRIGIQQYMGMELGLKDRMNDMINVMRHPEDVFDTDSINSFTNLVVTDDHPSGTITIDNVKRLQKGTVSHVQAQRDSLQGIITITDALLIDEYLKKKKKQVSVGFSYDLIPECGTYMGMDYEYKQINIKANHLAVVKAGRCGEQCKIGDKIMNEIVYANKKYSLNAEDDFKKLQKAITDSEEKKEAEEEQETKKEKDEEIEKKETDEKLDALKKENDKLKKENDELKSEKSGKDAEVDVLKKMIPNDEKIQAMIADKVKLLTDAKDILQDKMLDCTACDKEVKKAVIEKVLTLGDLSKRDAAYINVAYDMAVNQHRKAQDNLSALANDFSKKALDEDGKLLTRENVRQKYLVDHGLET